ncbi:MAG: ParA family protein [Thermomicrobiales bacterium]|nr:ParA family protein [Thermomicrobiales bacterium]
MHSFVQGREVRQGAGGRRDGVRRSASAPSLAASKRPSGRGSQPAPVVAFANQKGGVGKTTTAVNSAVALARHGYHVLLIDLDPQGNATSSLGVDKHAPGATTYDVLVDGVPAERVTIATGRARLDLMAANPMLAGAEIELVERPERERRLATALTGVLSRYDVVLIDCPPSLGLLTVNALTAARSVVVPIQCEYLALEGLGQLIATIDLVKQRLNPPLDVVGVLMTMYDARTRLSAHVVDEVRRFFPHRIFAAIVPRSIRLAEAPSYGQSIVEYDPGSRGADAYEHFAGELAERLRLPQPEPTAAD